MKMGTIYSSKETAEIVCNFENEEICKLYSELKKICDKHGVKLVPPPVNKQIYREINVIPFSNSVMYSITFSRDDCGVRLTNSDTELLFEFRAKDLTRK